MDNEVIVELKQRHEGDVSFDHWIPVETFSSEKVALTWLSAAWANDEIVKGQYRLIKVLEQIGE